MTVKEFLLQPKHITHRIEQLKILKKSYEELANSIPGGNYDQLVVQKTRSLEAPFVKWIDKIMEVEKKIAKAEEELNKVNAAVIKAIEAIPDLNYQNVLTLRYINLCTWNEICSALYISKQTGYRWHWDAINQISLPKQVESS